MSYPEQLAATKAFYPFDKWRESEGMEQYTQANCDKARAIFDQFIESLIALGEIAPVADKLALFQQAIEELNALSAEIDDLIETGEREELCELIDQITLAAGLIPSDYADGEGIADLWREW